MLSGVIRASCAVLDLVYPPDCVACGAPLENCGNGRICQACRSLLPVIGEWQCPRCGDELGPYTQGKRACPSGCTKKSLHFRGAVSVCRYESVARDLVHGLKYRGDLGGSAWMGHQIHSRLLKAPWFAQCSVIVPVPLHWTRRLSRRFNQSEMIALGITQLSSRLKLLHALSRTRKTPPQSLMEFSSRFENVKGAFKVSPKENLAGKTILLVDDVMTTCATAAECARVLRLAGAAKVYVAVFAR